MPRFRHIQNNFLGGEISPESWGRTDLDLYRVSCEEILNFIVKSRGGANYRPGTQFIRKEIVLYRPYNTLGLPVAQTLNGGSPVTLTGKVRIIPFVFNRDEAYAILITRFSGETGLAIINVDGYAESTITPIANTTWWSSSRFLSFANDDEIDEAQYSQSGDLIFFCHPNHPPWQLARTAANTFSIRPWWVSPTIFTDGFGTSSINLFGERGVPYFVNLNTTNTLSAPATGGGFNQTVNSSVSYFTPDMVGSVLKINSGGVTYYRFITVFNSSTDVTTQSGLSGAKPAIAATANWEQSEWYSGRGFPRSISFHEQRLFFGGTTKKPDTVWGSEIGDIFEFDALGAVTDPGYGTPTASDPFSLTVASTEVNQIQWLNSSKVLNTGTLGREYIARGVNAALSAVDVSVTSETAYGSNYRQPVRVENALLFLAKAATKIREFIFNRDEDAYTAFDITKLADHMPSKTLEQSLTQNKPEINHIAKQETDETLIWILDKNGGLFATTKDRQFGVNAFHYHRMGGTYQTKIPQVQSIASLPSSDGTTDDLWIAVQRTINANQVTYIEKMGKEFNLNAPFNSSSSIDDKMVFCDSAILFKPGGTFTIITGLSHLEGQTVVIVADGKYLGPKVVSGGQIDISILGTYTEAIVGLPYSGRIKSLNIEDGSGIGSSQGAVKKLDQLLIRFVKTIGAKFGFSQNKLIEIEFRPPDLAMDQAIPLFTGDKLLQMPLNYDREGRIVVQQDVPLPCRVACFTARGVAYDV
jgi:hypothetical protein